MPARNAELKYIKQKQKTGKKDSRFFVYVFSGR